MQFLNMVRYLIHNCFDNCFGCSSSLIVFDKRSAWFRAWLDDFQSGKALNAHLTTERFVRVFIAIDCCDFGETRKVFGGFFVCRLEVLAVATPGSVEPGLVVSTAA